MADQDVVNPGAIPPKVSPFAKPEGAAPMAPVAPGAPRPITVRLTKPGVPTAAPATAAPAAVGIATPPPANPHSTSRVPVPETVAAAVASAPSAIRPATVRLRPITAPGTQTGVFTPPQAPHAGSTQPITKMEISAAPAISTLQPQHPPAPGSNPLPEGPKPPSTAQVQAAKSKTSRISLDSAIGVAPVGAEKEGPKTIRLKRPTDLSVPGSTPVAPKPPLVPSARQTSRIPDSVLPTVEAAAGDSASVTQKKTLKIKRPGAAGASAEPTVTAAGGETAFPEGVQMTPISPTMEIPAGKAESSVFTAVAAIAACAAAVVLLLLTFCMASHAMGPDAGNNALASIKGPLLPWPGRLVD